MPTWGGSVKPKVFAHIPKLLAGPALELLATPCDVKLDHRDLKLPKQVLLREAKGKEGLICLYFDEIDEEVLDEAPTLRIVSAVAVGYDNIDVQAATRRGILLTNTPGVLDDTTADFAWALLFATARRVVEADGFVRAGRWKGRNFTIGLGRDIHHKTLGIVGLGRIGRAVARRALGFDMRILYTQRHRADEAVEKEVQAAYVDKVTLLKESDFVSLHIPLTPETHHFIGAKELNLMKPTAILINTARGPVVDEKALFPALQEGRIAGAGLDVFEREPKLERGLLRLKNIVLTPHIGSGSLETRTKMALVAAENLMVGLMGKRPPHLVNPEVLG